MVIYDLFNFDDFPGGNVLFIICHSVKSAHSTLNIDLYFANIISLPWNGQVNFAIFNDPSAFAFAKK